MLISILVMQKMPISDVCISYGSLLNFSNTYAVGYGKEDLGNEKDFTKVGLEMMTGSTYNHSLPCTTLACNSSQQAPLNRLCMDSACPATNLSYKCYAQSR